MSRSPRNIPFEDVDVRAARVYALNAEIASTDTFLAIIEQAFLAGCARYSHPAPGLGDPPAVRLGTPTSPSASPDLIPIYHRNGTVPCHRTAFSHQGPISRSARADLTKLRTYPLLEMISPNDVPRCGSCGSTIEPYSTQDLDWAAAIEQSERLFTPRANLHPTPPIPTPTPFPDPFEPGADSPPTVLPESGRTPTSDESGGVDVQPSAQPDQLARLHDLATGLFKDRPTSPTSHAPDS